MHVFRNVWHMVMRTMSIDSAEDMTKELVRVHKGTEIHWGCQHVHVDMGLHDFAEEGWWKRVAHARKDITQNLDPAGEAAVRSL